ncbi:hypothetical protein DL93DRAFT_345934 [Clavulina sp. PMI_390]|nr:hypothetical protein DL93DRAFT_345934 [Clavulina sp. PMI_390]
MTGIFLRLSSAPLFELMRQLPSSTSYATQLVSFSDDKLFSRVSTATALFRDLSRDYFAKRREHNSHTPILSLPAEILSEISLLSVCPLDMMIWKHPILSVSSWWRTCVINSPHIWSHIYIGGGTESGARTECWFRRSGGSALTIVARDMEAFNNLQHTWTAVDLSPGQRIRYLCLNDVSFSPPCPFPLMFDTKNLERLDVEFGAFMRDNGNDTEPTLRLFNQSPPARLQHLELQSYWLLPRVVNLIGFNPSHLVCLRLGIEVSYDDILDLLPRASSLERLYWDPPAPHNHQGRPITPKGTSWLTMSALQYMHVGAKGGLNVLELINTPRLSCFSFQADGLGRLFPSLLSFMANAKQITHLKITDSERTLTYQHVASLLYALPNLEYFDPAWRYANIRGILALCGEYPEVTTQVSHPSPWACPTIRFFYLPVAARIRQEVLSVDALCICLGMLLEARGQVSSLSSSDGPLPITGPTQATASRFSIVVDVNVEVMVSILGEKWRNHGGVCVEELKFPEI